MYFLDNVQKKYDDAMVLSSLTGEIRTDGLVFIMGASGSGKSTLLRLLSFVETPDSGHIRLDLSDAQYFSGSNTKPWPLVTCVFQKQFLWPHLTLRQNIELPLQNLSQATSQKRLSTIIELFHMSGFIDRYPNQVSGGQAQRAALARAFVLDPKLILMDEVHGGLDLEQQNNLNEYMLLLRTQAGVGFIVVTHSLAFTRRYADQIVVLENGKAVEIGGPELLRHPQSEFLKTALRYHDAAPLHP